MNRMEEQEKVLQNRLEMSAKRYQKYRAPNAKQEYKKNQPTKRKKSVQTTKETVHSHGWKVVKTRQSLQDKEEELTVMRKLNVSISQQNQKDTCEEKERLNMENQQPALIKELSI